MTRSARQVFISYAREDSQAAARLCQELKRAELDPWLDAERLLPGQQWKLAISQAIQQSEYFLALLSSSSISKKGYVQKELLVAMDVLDEFPKSEIFIIPVRLDDCTPADPRLRDLHWADLFPSWEEGLSKILLAMRIPSSAEYPSPPDDLERRIADEVDTSRFETLPASYKGYLGVVRELEGDEYLHILWDDTNKRLVKYYQTYDGVRWYGPQPLDERDREKVRVALRRIGDSST